MEFLKKIQDLENNGLENVFFSDEELKEVCNKIDELDSFFNNINDLPVLGEADGDWKYIRVPNILLYVFKYLSPKEKNELAFLILFKNKTQSDYLKFSNKKLFFKEIGKGKATGTKTLERLEKKELVSLDKRGLNLRSWKWITNFWLLKTHYKSPITKKQLIFYFRESIKFQELRVKDLTVEGIKDAIIQFHLHRNIVKQEEKIKENYAALNYVCEMIGLDFKVIENILVTNNNVEFNIQNYSENDITNFNSFKNAITEEELEVIGEEIKRMVEIIKSGKIKPEEYEYEVVDNKILKYDNDILVKEITDFITIKTEYGETLYKFKDEDRLIKIDETGKIIKGDSKKIISDIIKGSISNNPLVREIRTLNVLEMISKEIPFIINTKSFKKYKKYFLKNGRIPSERTFLILNQKMFFYYLYFKKSAKIPMWFIPIITAENLARKTGYSKNYINEKLNEWGIKVIYTFSGNEHDEFLIIDNPMDKHKYFHNGCFKGRLILENSKNFFVRESSRKSNFNSSFLKKKNVFIQKHKKEIWKYVMELAEERYEYFYFKKEYSDWGLQYDSEMDEFFNFKGPKIPSDIFKTAVMKVIEDLKKEKVNYDF
jgi:hypothetical protein